MVRGLGRPPGGMPPRAPGAPHPNPWGSPPGRGWRRGAGRARAPKPMAIAATQAMSSVGGTVTDERGTPIRRGVSVCIQHDDGTQVPGEVRCVHGDELGRFEWVGLVPGSYRLWAAAPGFVSGSFESSSRGEVKGVLSLGETEHRGDVRILLRAGGARIAGIVMDAGGGPIAGALVEAMADAAPGGLSSVAWTEADGRYQLTTERAREPSRQWRTATLPCGARWSHRRRQ